MFLSAPPANNEQREECEAYFKMIRDVAVTEDYALVDKINRGLNSGISRKVLLGRNEPGVQNMHRQVHDVLGL